MRRTFIWDGLPKRMLALLAAALFAVLLLIAAAQGAALAAPGATGGGGSTGGGGTSSSWDYVALGDSLATGFGARKGYVPRYRDYVKTDTGVTVKLTNLGKNGWTSKDLLHALQNDPNFRGAVSGAEVVSWNIGGNDLRAARDSYKNRTCEGADNQDCLRATVGTLKGNWEGITVEILKLRSSSNTIIRTMDIYNPYVDEDRGADSWGDDNGDGSVDQPAVSDFQVFKTYVDDVNNHIAATSTSTTIPYARVYEAFNGEFRDQDPAAKGYIGPDGLHPNDTGHKVMADLLRGLGYAPLK